jgi:hypothetical protein
MKTDYVKKGLAIGIVVLFVCVGLSSAVAINKLIPDNVELNDTLSYIGNDPPYKPNIYGPSNGLAYAEYTFCTDEIVDPEGDYIYCWWDWGDGNNSDWLGPYNSGEIICESHIWTEAGVYFIRLKLKDDGGWESDWSDLFEITIFENHPPSRPVIYYEHRIVRGVEFDYYFNATDPDGEDVRFHIDWGDATPESTDFVKSGEVVTVGHTYFTQGIYSIYAYAEDIHNARGPAETKTVWWNRPPNMFSIKGPMFPKPGETYTWTFYAHDPDNDNVSYYIEWGDGQVTNWSNFYPSQLSIRFNHTFYSKHIAWIRAKAKDIYDYESDWRYLWPFPKDKVVNLNSLLLKLLDKLPLLERLFLMLQL